MRKVTVQPSGQVFEVQEGESVLTAALRQDLVLERAGRDALQVHQEAIDGNKTTKAQIVEVKEQ